jgi:hypothetical protein
MMRILTALERVAIWHEADADGSAPPAATGGAGGTSPPPAMGDSSVGSAGGTDTSGIPHAFGTVPGGVDAATDFAKGAAGKPYDYGGMGEGVHNPATGGPGTGHDCSGYIADIANAMSGQPTGTRPTDSSGGQFNTTSDMSEFGFQPGNVPGAFNIGVNPSAGEEGHMAGTMPDGTNVESNGTNGVQYGGAAAGADHPQFSDKWHLPVSDSLGSAGGPGT